MLRRSISLLLAALAAAGCASKPKVVSEMNPSVTFGVYRTFNWVGPGIEPPVGERRSGGVDKSIRGEVEAGLAARGLAKTSSPSLLVDYGVAVERENTKTIIDYGRYVSEGGEGFLADAYVNGYDRGTLVVHLYDARTGTLVWRGSTTSIIPDNEDEGAARMRQAIGELLATLPRQ